MRRWNLVMRNYTAYEKLYKLSEKHEKLYRLATKKLSDVELGREELSTMFDEANQTIGALRFKNNFLAEKTKKLEAGLFQVRAQLKRTSSVKLDEMLSIQKCASDCIGLGYDFSCFLVLSLSRKMLKTLELRRLTLKSLNKRSIISIIIVELSVIFDQIAISG